MLIYRVENEFGDGPYYGGVQHPEWDIDKFTGPAHPLPEKDLGMKDVWTKLSSMHKHQYHFGFNSVEQLLEWFYEDKWLQAMHLNGFKVVVFEVEECDAIIGANQVVFKRNKSTQVDVIVISNL